MNIYIYIYIYVRVLSLRSGGAALRGLQIVERVQMLGNPSGGMWFVKEPGRGPGVIIISSSSSSGSSGSSGSSSTSSTSSSRSLFIRACAGKRLACVGAPFHPRQKMPLRGRRATVPPQRFAAAAQSVVPSPCVTKTYTVGVYSSIMLPP